MKSKEILIGLAILVVAGGCLLWVGVSKNTQGGDESQIAASASQTTVTTTLPAVASSSSATTTGTASKSGSAASAVAPMRFEVVSTQAAQEQGLGGRAVIPDNYGMLFVFSKDDTYGFWMKDMLTSIDMIWLSDNGTIVKIDDSVAADTYPDVFYPPQPVKYVLETRAGFAREKGWHVGTRVALPLPYGK